MNCCSTKTNRMALVNSNSRRQHKGSARNVGEQVTLHLAKKCVAQAYKANQLNKHFSRCDGLWTKNVVKYLRYNQRSRRERYSIDFVNLQWYSLNGRFFSLELELTKVRSYMSGGFCEDVRFWEGTSKKGLPTVLPPGTKGYLNVCLNEHYVSWN